MAVERTKQNSNISGGMLTDEEIERLRKELPPAIFNELMENLSNYNRPLNQNNSYQDYYISQITGTPTSSESNPSIESLYTGFGGYVGSSVADFGIFNMPHQWTKEADPRAYSDDWRGRVYLQHIMENTPSVIFKAGRPRYMDPSDSGTGALAALMNMENDDERTSHLDELYPSTDGNETYYYTFEDDWDNFVSYVNGLVRYTAVNMGIDGFKDFNLDTTSMRSDSWIQNFFSGALGLSHYVAFYVEAGGTSSSDSGSNSTAESQIASGLKTLGQTKRELDFLLGNDSRANQNANASDDAYTEWANNLKSTYSGISGIDGILNKLAGAHTSITTGANLLFPQIWSDSQFTASYSVEIKLQSPYGDKYSIFQNIMIPLLTLLSLSLPRQSGKQGYTGPFIIQCWSKGWFSVNCGIIDSIDIKKGGSSGKEWSIDNLPTEVNVTLNIKDLYPTIMSTSYRGRIAFANNVGLTEYLKCLSGIQLSDFQPTMSLQQALNALLRGVTDIPNRIYRKSQSAIGSGTKKAITKIFGGMR